MKTRLANLSMAALAVLVSIGFAGCSNKTSDAVLVPVTVLEAQPLVQGKSKLLGLGGRDTAVYVDCRPETDFAAGHIPGAISLPYERVTRDHKMLEKYDILIVYGGDYNDASAKGMSKRLLELEHSDVRTLIGGLRAWKTEGNPIETGAPAAANNGR